MFRVLLAITTLTLACAAQNVGSNPAYGKYKDSPEFTGGKAYSYQHCVALGNWVLNKSEDAESLSAVRLGNLWYTLDNCQFIFGFYTDPRDRHTAQKIPVSIKQYDEDSLTIEMALHAITHEYTTRLDQVFAAMPHELRQRVQTYLEEPGTRFSKNGLALWQQPEKP